jgi:hypothetical protein
MVDDGSMARRLKRHLVEAHHSLWLDGLEVVGWQDEHSGSRKVLEDAQHL